jgi:general secretion pathway protein I
VRVRSAGFTLIEVLVALAIVAIGMAAVLESLTASANTVLYLKDKTLAQWVGLNQIANTRLQLQPGQVPMTGNTTGDMDYAGRSWHWRQEVTPTQVVGIVRIDVKVRPADVKAGDDNGWFSTVSGIAGDALAAAQGTTPTWGNGGEQCQPGMPNCNPQCPQGTQGTQPGTTGIAGGTAGCNPNTPANQQQPCPAGKICPSQTPTNQSPITPTGPSGGLSGGDSGLGGGDDFGGNSGGLGGNDSSGGLGGSGSNSGGLGGSGSNSGGLGGNGSNSGGLGSDSH